MNGGGISRAVVSALLIVLVAAGGLLVAGRSQEDSDGRASAKERAGTPVAEVPAGRAGRLAGYVRDGAGYPVRNATVGIAGDSGGGVRTDSQGRYRDLALPRRRATLVARHPGYAPRHVAVARRPSGGRLDFSLAATDPDMIASNGADQVLFWVNCETLAGEAEQAIDELMELGVDGFVCAAGRLPSMGGEHAFGPGHPGGAPEHRLHRILQESAVVRRARQGRLQVYLGFYASNAQNRRTPFEDWFDDEAWSTRLLPEVTDLARAARELGFAGVALDQELYPVQAGPQPSWAWAYPGNVRSEQEVRRRVEDRGRQLMEALLAGYPGIEVAAYDTQLPGTWAARVQEVVNGRDGVFEDDVRADLWSGLASVPGYSAIRWFDATFYKTPHVSEDWETGLRYNAFRVYSELSQRVPNWPYALARLHLSPFSWINGGPTEFSAAREPAYVAAQLASFREWGMGGAIANFNYGALGDFDYGAYDTGLEAASTPGVVDSSPPRLAVNPPVATGDGPVRVSGSVDDNFAIRGVYWYDQLGRFGAARLNWEPSGGRVRFGAPGRATWQIDDIAASPRARRVTVVVEDIKGLASAREIRLDDASGG